MISTFLYLLLSVVLVIVSWFITREYKANQKWAILKKLPGPIPTLIIGNLRWAMALYSRKSEYPPGVYILERMSAFALLYRKFGLYTFWVGSTPVVNVCTPQIFETILGNSTSLDKSHEYNFLHPWLGLGLLTSTGSKWRTRRKLLTPSFHFNILKDQLITFNDQSMVLVEKLKTLVNQEYVDISPLVVLCTLDIVCESVMGVQIGAQKDSDSDYVKAIHNLGDYFNKRTISPWQWSDFLYSFTKGGREFAKDVHILHSFTEKVIKEKKQSIMSQPAELSTEAISDDFSRKKRSFMDILLDMHINGQHLDELDIREEVDTFMFEGHDTTAMGIIFALYCIGLYPKVQQKIAEELDDIFGSDKDRWITYEDTKKMKYLECTLKESQRLFPSVPLIGRTMNEELKVGDFTIPKDTAVHLFIYYAHHNPDYYPNPEVFDPDRFLPENALDRHPYSYIPFSAGPRNCIGQKFAMLEEKTVVCNILRHFKVVSLDPRDKVQVKMEFTLRPAQPVRLKFIPLGD